MEVWCYNVNVVDEDGYITVTQDHCSNYVITKPTDDAETSKSDVNSGTPSGNADNTTTNYKHYYIRRKKT